MSAVGAASKFSDHDWYDVFLSESRPLSQPPSRASSPEPTIGACSASAATPQVPNARLETSKASVVAAPAIAKTASPAAPQVRATLWPYNVVAANIAAKAAQHSAGKTLGLHYKGVSSFFDYQNLKCMWLELVQKWNLEIAAYKLRTGLEAVLTQQESSLLARFNVFLSQEQAIEAHFRSYSSVHYKLKQELHPFWITETEKALMQKPLQVSSRVQPTVCPQCQLGVPLQSAPQPQPQMHLPAAAASAAQVNLVQQTGVVALGTIQPILTPPQFFVVNSFAHYQELTHKWNNLLQPWNVQIALFTTKYGRPPLNSNKAQSDIWNRCAQFFAWEKMVLAHFNSVYKHQPFFIDSKLHPEWFSSIDIQALQSPFELLLEVIVQTY